MEASLEYGEQKYDRFLPKKYSGAGPAPQLEFFGNFSGFGAKAISS